MKKHLLWLLCLFLPLWASPQADKEYGDAPEGAIAYPSTGLMGSFPTCMSAGPAGFIMHSNFGAFFLSVDFEFDGNAGTCPLFAPYDMDECFNDGDAGLLVPQAYTIVNNVVVPCSTVQGSSLGLPCSNLSWGTDVDILVTNFMPNITTGYVNVLFDWNRNGVWGDIVTCPSGACPEHVLVNHLVQNGFSGPLSATGPPGFLSGPNAGFQWARFSITEIPVPVNWDGQGTYEDGESEDYLIYLGDYDLGDAPEGALAYPASGVTGNFPVCMNVGTAGSYIRHAAGATWFGPAFDLEPEGNAGSCPVFTPNLYDQDECFSDNDAGLIMPSPYTITGPAGQETVVPCSGSGSLLDTICRMAVWGQDIDIAVTGTGYVNVLVDWNMDGQWLLDTTTKCNGVVVPEHVLADFYIQNAVNVPLSSLLPPGFMTGPYDGFAWARFSLTPSPVGPGWSGAGDFSDGESEDYLLEIADDVTAINLVYPDAMVPLRVSPNPVRDQLNIEYTMRSEGFVTLDLISSQGRYVATVDQGIRAKGNHRITVDAVTISKQINNGFYIVRLRIEGKPVVYQRIVVVR